MLLLVSQICDGSELGAVFHPGAIWTDQNGAPINAHGGGILFHAGIYYWFGEHKLAGDVGNYAQIGVHVYSSKNLYQWKDEGVALKVSNDPQSEIARGCIIERPKVIYNAATKQFVMWFHLELLGQGYRAARSGVAVADNVAGPYRYLGSQRPNAGVWPMNVPEDMKKPLTTAEAEAISKIVMAGGPMLDYPINSLFRRDFTEGQMARDMTLFVDDDGTAYQIYSSEENGVLQISQLSDDYLRSAGKYIRVFPGDFNEAPAMFKHAGKYYLITSGCTGWAPNAARLAEANTIFGPWKKLGNPCLGPANRITNTFNSQSAFVLPVDGKEDAFIFMADRWNPTNAIDGRHIWLPIQFGKDGRPFIEWKDQWDLSCFNSKSSDTATSANKAGGSPTPKTAMNSTAF